MLQTVISLLEYYSLNFTRSEYHLKILVNDFNRQSLLHSTDDYVETIFNTIKNDGYHFLKVYHILMVWAEIVIIISCIAHILVDYKESKHKIINLLNMFYSFPSSNLKGELGKAFNFLEEHYEESRIEGYIYNSEEIDEFEKRFSEIGMQGCLQQYFNSLPLIIIIIVIYF